MKRICGLVLPVLIFCGLFIQTRYEHQCACDLSQHFQEVSYLASQKAIVILETEHDPYFHETRLREKFKKEWERRKLPLPQGISYVFFWSELSSVCESECDGVQIAMLMKIGRQQYTWSVRYRIEGGKNEN